LGRKKAENLFAWSNDLVMHRFLKVAHVILAGQKAEHDLQGPGDSLKYRIPDLACRI
jgi:hypothetical protein